MHRWVRTWNGPWLAALIALIAALPGALALPVTDPGEARLAQASAHMLEERDFTAAAFDEDAPDRLPMGAHWIQAGVVLISGHAQTRRVWAYRLPAIAGAMIAAAACAWGAGALFGAAPGLLAGALLGSSLILSVAGAIDGPAALLCAGVTLAIAALARLRLAAEGQGQAGALTRLLLWLGVALAALEGGPIGPVAVILTGAVLAIGERRAAWLKTLGWGWGLILLVALVGPSVVAGAIAEAQDAAAASVELGDRTPGLQLLLTPLALFPFALILPGAVMAMGRARREVGGRIALAWLIPAGLVLEFSRAPSLTGALLVDGAVAWLCALAMRDGVGPRAARVGVGVQAVAAAVLIALMLMAAARFGGAAAWAFALATGAVIAVAAFWSGALMLRGRAWRAVGVAGALGLVAHIGAAGLAPRLTRLWIAPRAAEALAKAGLDPRDGVIAGPVAVAGFEEPSLDFAIGGLADTGTAEDAAQAIREGRPAIVSQGEEPAFLAALGPRKARRAADIEGYDYAARAAVRLTIWGPGAAP
jgi:4-amino-4-deoxy-L-arabinose transferase-like glycosyltransferase